MIRALQWTGQALMAGGMTCVFLLVAATGCKPASGDARGGKSAAKPPVLVKAATATTQSIPVILNGIGTVDPITTIQVRAQVGGELIKAHFRGGDRVDEDQVLFTIDPRPYEVALAQAEANCAKMAAVAEQARAQLVRDRAQADNAQAELERNKPLLPKRMVSKEEFESVRTTAEALKAAVAASEAGIKSADESVRAAKVAIEDAKLKLEYCTIRSPIDGQTGSVLIHVGNLIKANDTTPLLVINQIEPINVTFTLPERDLSAVRSAMAQGPLGAKALPQGSEDKPAEGTVHFIDNEVSETTGTIRLKALFPNEDARLWPGQFVRVELRIAVRTDAVVVPSRALQTGQQGAYVYVIKPDMTVEVRPVTTGESHEEWTIIANGLSKDEQVVTDGQLKLTPGASVTLATETAPAGDAK